jgi:hypothetical protein
MFVGMRVAITMLLALIAFGAPQGTASQDPALAPDGAVYWCPMHRDIRGHAGDRCTRCGMALVPASATDYQPYVLDFEIVPRAIRAHQKAHVRFHARDPHTGATVRRFDVVHERVFHLFIVSHDLEYFAHVHPTLHRDGSLNVDMELPRAGAYQMIADFTPAGGPPQLAQASFITAGYTGPLSVIPKLVADGADKIVGGARIKLTMPEALAGREQLITFDLQDETTGSSVRDLEPYLGATGHLLVTSADRAVAFHSHPVAGLSTTGGPTVVFQVLFPRPGDYRMWVQLQRHGQVLTSSFTVPVKGLY